jgi:hypothetical protein
MTRPPPTGPWVYKPGDVAGVPLSTWDQKKADEFVGKYVLAGITSLASDHKTVESQWQYHGRIVRVDRIKGIEVECEGQWAGHLMTLPPTLDAFFPARPGEYRLRSTGEVILNPDLTTQWTRSGTS